MNTTTETLPVLSITNPTEMESMYSHLNKIKEDIKTEEIRVALNKGIRNLTRNFERACLDQYQIQADRVRMLPDKEFLLFYHELVKRSGSNLAKYEKFGRLRPISLWGGGVLVLASFIFCVLSAKILPNSFGALSTLGTIGGLVSAVALPDFFTNRRDSIYDGLELFLTHQELEKLGYCQDDLDGKLLKLLKPAKETKEGGER